MHSDWSQEEDWDRTQQKDRERLDKTIREQQRKIAEERRKKREEKNGQLCLPYPTTTKPNSPLIDPLVPAPEEKEENMRQEEDKDCTTQYYPPSPIYMVSNEEDVPTLLNDLVPEPAPTEKKDTNKTEGDVAIEDRRDFTETTDKEDDLDSDLDLDYFY